MTKQTVPQFVTQLAPFCLSEGEQSATLISFLSEAALRDILWKAFMHMRKCRDMCSYSAYTFPIIEEIDAELAAGDRSLWMMEIGSIIPMDQSRWSCSNIAPHYLLTVLTVYTGILATWLQDRSISNPDFKKLLRMMSLLTADCVQAHSMVLCAASYEEWLSDNEASF